MIEFYLTSSAPRRVVCRNARTFRYFWPFFFSRAVPEARPLCRWAAQRGATIHGAVRLQHDHTRGCHLIVTRPLTAGTSLITLPLSLGLDAAGLYDSELPSHAHVLRAHSHYRRSAVSSSHESICPGGSDVRVAPRCRAHSTHCGSEGNAVQSNEDECRWHPRGAGDEAGWWSMVGRLAERLVRELHNPRSPHRVYLEFLHDLYSNDEDGGNLDLDADNAFGSHACATQARKAAVHGASLQQQLDALYGGNALHAGGVPNAPFLAKATLQSVRQRVAWVHAHSMRRRLEQSVPHFAVSAVRWAISMALSRAVVDDAGGLTVYPLIDFCAHSFRPTAALSMTHTTSEAPSMASAADAHEAAKRHAAQKVVLREERCVYLRARRDMARGEAVTVLYSARGVSMVEDAEYWRMNWGFVPPPPV